jgi:hypothetical protein
MKIRFTLILFFNLLAIFTVYSQTRVTINLKSADFKKVISTIEHQSIYHFVYSERKIPVLNKADISFDNEDVRSILDKILANSGFAYTELANHLIVIAPVDEIVNIVKVTGIVIDETGVPLAGATVRVKGSTMGASTDQQGAFSFEAPDQSTLIISFVGYVTRDVKLSGTSLLKVTLTASNILSEVVVTALGIKKDEKKVGYSVTTIGSEVLDKAKESNVAYSLEGRIAGLSISGVNGGPASSARILLRGVTSFGASAPPVYY